MRLLLARHGESEANTLRVISNRNFPHALTARGMVQAAALAQKLQDLKITKVYASPILRAMQTAEIISNHLGLDVSIEDALREPDCGELEGRSDAAAWTLHAQVRQDWFVTHQWDAHPLGGESYNDVVDRLAVLLENRSSTDGCAVCVTHGLLIQILLHHFVGVEGTTALAACLPDYAQVIAIEPEGRQWKFVKDFE